MLKFIIVLCLINQISAIEFDCEGKIDYIMKKVNLTNIDMYMLKSHILHIYYKSVEAQEKLNLIPKMNNKLNRLNTTEISKKLDTVLDNTTQINRKLDTVYELLTNIMLINDSSVVHTTLSSDLPTVPIEYVMLGMFLILVIDTLLLIILIISKWPSRDTGRSIQA